MISRIVFLAVALAWDAHPLAAQTPASFVDPLIGTAPNPYTRAGYSFDTGNVFPGAVCPRGMVAWSPDTTHNSQIAGGYWYPDDKIEGFSLTHFSGRGVPCLKNIAFMPLVQSAETSPGRAWKQYAAVFSHQNETASPGYYRVRFDNGLETELTVTPRTGLARFKFPPSSVSTLLIRADGAVTILGNEVFGHADAKVPGGGQYKIYFNAQFPQPFKSVRTWVADQIGDAPAAKGAVCGALLMFDTSSDPVVQVRVGISYTSLENAKDNLNRENRGWDFAAVTNQAASLWNHELNLIRVEGGTEAETKVFYTALYHCFIHPNLLDDANGQYLGMDRKIHQVPTGHHQYQNVPAWDQHRSHAPLMAILDPKTSSDVIQSLVNYARQDASVRTNGGGLPRWEQVNRNSGGMVGDGDDTIIASSYVFGATQFDLHGAWAAMDKGATRPGTTSDGHPVREQLDDYLALGYVPDDAAVTLEYCHDDFALAQFAEIVGDRQKSAAFLKRAQNWQNLFDPSTGYLRPRHSDGAWLEDFSPASGDGFVEGTAAQYLWLVNFNFRTLIDKLGGNAQAVARLDRFFTKLNDGLNTEFAYLGNEPCEETPWVYDFAAAPWRTQAVVRRIQTELFTTQPSGLPGNDDAGALSSWYVFSVLGLYPEIPGVAGFVVGSPLFPRATVRLANGNTLQINSAQASPSHPYVQRLQLNGQDRESPWIPWSDLSNGSVLDFDLAAKQSPWGNDPSKAPPSFDGK